MDIRSRKSPQRRELSKTMSNPNLSLKRNRSREQLQKNKDNKLSKELAEQTRLKKRIEMMQAPELLLKVRYKGKKLSVPITNLGDRCLKALVEPNILRFEKEILSKTSLIQKIRNSTYTRLKIGRLLARLITCAITISSRINPCPSLRVKSSKYNQYGESSPRRWYRSATLKSLNALEQEVILSLYRLFQGFPGSKKERRQVLCAKAYGEGGTSWQWQGMRRDKLAGYYDWVGQPIRTQNGLCI
jgi:hypothetical protein